MRVKKLEPQTMLLDVMNGALDHMNVHMLERPIVRTAYKRKATDQISERPSKSTDFFVVVYEYWGVKLT